MEHPYKTILFVTGMLVTGTLNTILNKLQDRQCVSNCGTVGAKNFEQPLWQTLNMFIGEFSCILVYIWMKQSTIKLGDTNEEVVDILQAHIRPHNLPEQPSQKLIGLNNIVMSLPTMFDICGTTLMNIGLIYTSASVYQMLRGAIVLFVGLFSVIFLDRKLERYQWASLILIVMGVSCVGLSSIFSAQSQQITYNTGMGSWIGVMMILLAQMFSASQFVVEEKIMSKYSIQPVKAVWLEGFFGLLIVGSIMPIMHIAYGSQNPGSYFDVVGGFNQIVSNTGILLIGFFIAISIGLFNMFGLSITRTISATSRSTIDTSRTVFIWMISLALGWESFNIWQVVGFVCLVYATFVFNNVIDPPAFFQAKEPQVMIVNDENIPLIHEDHN